MELQVCHERGPLYVSPQDLTGFIARGVNEASDKKVLKEPEG